MLYTDPIMLSMLNHFVCLLMACRHYNHRDNRMSITIPPAVH